MSPADHRTPNDIERDLDATRDDLDATLDALTSRLDPQGMWDQALSYVRTNGGTFGENFMVQVRENPLPATLAGIGLAWLMASGGNGAGGGPSAGRLRDAGHAVGAKAGEARARAGENRARAGEKAGDARGAIGERAGAMRARAGETAGQARARGGDALRGAGDRLSGAGRSAGTFFQDHPLAAGAAALAFGAFAASMTPRTRAEEEYLEPLRDRAGERIRREAADRAEQAVGAAREKKSEADERLEGQREGDRRQQQTSSSTSAGTASPGAPTTPHGSHAAPAARPTPGGPQPGAAPD